MLSGARLLTLLVAKPEVGGYVGGRVGTEDLINICWPIPDVLAFFCLRCTTTRFYPGI